MRKMHKKCRRRVSTDFLVFRRFFRFFDGFRRSFPLKNVKTLRQKIQKSRSNQNPPKFINGHRWPAGARHAHTDTDSGTDGRKRGTDETKTEHRQNQKIHRNPPTGTDGPNINGHRHAFTAAPPRQKKAPIISKKKPKHKKRKTKKSTEIHRRHRWPPTATKQKKTRKSKKSTDGTDGHRQAPTKQKKTTKNQKIHRNPPTSTDGHRQAPTKQKKTTKNQKIHRNPPTSTDGHRQA